MPKKIRELKATLKKAGFSFRPGKGSHTFWTHPLVPEDPITIPGKDGDDAKKYLEKQIERILAKLEEVQKVEETDTEEE